MTRPWISLSALVALVCLGSGCSLTGAKGTTAAAAPGPKPAFENVKMTYRSTGDRVNVLAAQQQNGPVQVNYQTAPATLLPSQSACKLEIQYPHPDKQKPGMALAILQTEVNGDSEERVLKPDSTWTGIWHATKDAFPGLRGTTWHYEVHSADIPVAELGWLLGQLDRGGFFADTAAAQPATYLDARVDARRSSRNWGAVPELDAIIIRTRSHGRLVTSITPRGKSSPTGAPAAQMARGGGGAPPSGQPAIGAVPPGAGAQQPGPQQPPAVVIGEVPPAPFSNAPYAASSQQPAGAPPAYYSGAGTQTPTAQPQGYLPKGQAYYPPPATEGAVAPPTTTGPAPFMGTPLEARAR